MAIQGPSGSGKTATALLTALGLVRHYGGKIGVIDTQNAQSLDYVDTRFAPLGFDVFHLPNGNPESLRNAVMQFGKGEYTVLIIDSLSIAWAGEGGLLDQSAGFNDKDRFSGWNDLGKTQNKLLNTIGKSPCHVIATIQSKTEWVYDVEEREGGRKVNVPKKVGLAPVQRKGIEYLWPLYVTMDLDHNMRIDRVNAFEDLDRAVIHKPDETWVGPLIEWMEKGNVSRAIPALYRTATKEQVAEYYEHCELLGLSKITVDAEFLPKYGTPVDGAAEEFLEERLTELREKTKSKRAMIDAKRKQLQEIKDTHPQPDLSKP